MLTLAQTTKIEERWYSGLYSKIVSNLIYSAYNRRGRNFDVSQNIVFDNLDGFAVRDSDLRARVKLNLSPPPRGPREGE
ncbi:uncharacterized protein PG998_008940 [Apiospora kogelbergensis]|uniref:uncharacterized protein n=1 Tax=Apiospora kogelbergensis TaxID=1337665 RepID=UPI003131E087